MENLSRSIVRYLRHDPTAPVDENAYVEGSHLMKFFHASFYHLQAAVHQPTDKQRLHLKLQKIYKSSSRPLYTSQLDKLRPGHRRSNPSVVLLP